MADKNYSEAGFWQKLNTFARKAGRELVDKSYATLLCRRVTRYAQVGKRCDLLRPGLFRSTD